LRALLFTALATQFVAAAAGVLAIRRPRLLEAAGWFALAYLLPLRPVLTQPWSLQRGAVLAALALGTALAANWALAAALAAFFVIPIAGGVINYPHLHTPGLAGLSDWARTSTGTDAVFLFPDAGRALDPGIFRSEAQRAVYVDWKSGGQVNYLEHFGEQWWFRWQQTMAAGFQPEALAKYEALGIQYVVIQGAHRLPRAPAYQNAQYAVYRAAPEAQPEEAISGILKAFDTHSVVAIGEDHWIEQAGDFYLALVKDRRFAEKVHDIVIEFASRTSQPILDRYIAGEDVPFEQLSQVWRNSTKVFSWESPIYHQLLEAVRESNRSFEAGHHLRVLAGDAPIDWTKVETHEQWLDTQPNNPSFAAVINQEVLDRARRALVILGNNHLTKGGDRSGEPDVTTLVEGRHPGSVFVILLFFWDPPEAAGRLAAVRPPALYPLDQPWLAALPYGPRRLRDVADAMLYLGPAREFRRAMPDWNSLDAAYLKELDRRSRIEWGCGFDIERWKKLQYPCEQRIY